MSKVYKYDYDKQEFYLTDLQCPDHNNYAYIWSEDSYYEHVSDCDINTIICEGDCNEKS